MVGTVGDIAVRGLPFRLGGLLVLDLRVAIENGHL